MRSLRNRSIFLLSLFAIVIVGCCHLPLSGNTKAKNESARQWLSSWSGNVDFRGAPVTNAVPVSLPNLSEAQSALAGTPSIQISLQQALHFVGSISPGSTPSGWPYLVRAVGDARHRFPVQVFFRSNGDLWVAGGANNPCGW